MTRLVVAESVLRLFSVCLAIGAACILGLNKETKMLLVDRTATVKDFLAFWVLTIVLSVAGGYNFLQFCKCLFLAKYDAKYRSGCKKWGAWVSFLFDQVLTYIVVAAVAAALQVGLLGMTGQDEFQWMKLTDKYKRYSLRSTGGIGCALMASGSMTFLNILSAHQLFGLYPSNP